MDRVHPAGGSAWPHHPRNGSVGAGFDALHALYALALVDKGLTAVREGDCAHRADDRAGVRHAFLAHVRHDHLIFGALFARGPDDIDYGRREHLFLGKGLLDARGYRHVVELLDEREPEGEPDPLAHDREFAVGAAAVAWLAHIDDAEGQLFDIFGFFMLKDKARDADENLSADIGAWRVESAHSFEHLRHGKPRFALRLWASPKSSPKSSP